MPFGRFLQTQPVPGRNCIVVGRRAQVRRAIRPGAFSARPLGSQEGTRSKMAAYAIRVELQGYPTREQYDALHALMARKGFSQSITGTDGQNHQRQYNLPHAVYYGSSNSGVGAVRDSVVNAIKAEIQQKILVFVVEVLNWGLGW